MDIVKREEQQVILQREQEQFEYDYRLSKALAASQMTGVFKTPEQVFTAIQYGRGHGWSPMQSLRNLYPLHGNVHLTAIAAMGMVLPYADEAPSVERESKDGKPYSCTVTYIRDGKSFSRSFSIDDAKAAGLVKGGGAWTAYAENMLYWRAGMFAAREAFPDVLAGIYSIEEMSNSTVEEHQMKNVTPDSNKGTGLLDQLNAATDGEEDNWPKLQYDKPDDTQPDPDTIVTAEQDVVDPEPKKKTPRKKPSDLIKETEAAKSKPEDIQPEMF